MNTKPDLPEPITPLVIPDWVPDCLAASVRKTEYADHPQAQALQERKRRLITDPLMKPVWQSLAEDPLKPGFRPRRRLSILRHCLVAACDTGVGIDREPLPVKEQKQALKRIRLEAKKLDGELGGRLFYGSALFVNLEQAIRTLDRQSDTFQRLVAVEEQLRRCRSFGSQELAGLWPDPEIFQPLIALLPLLATLADTAAGLALPKPLKAPHALRNAYLLGVRHCLGLYYAHPNNQAVATMANVVCAFGSDQWVNARDVRSLEAL